MSYRLSMSAEIHDWLADLRTDDPAAARLIGTALTALLVDGASLGPPMVILLSDSRPQADVPELLDESYQRRLERQQMMRWGLSEAAMLARDIRLRIAHLESLQASPDQHGPAADDPAEAAGQVEAADPAEVAPAGAAGGLAGLAGADEAAVVTEADDAAAGPADVAEQLEQLRRLLPGVIENERKLRDRSTRIQARTDEFRTRKESLKARYTAARAEVAVDHAFATAADAGDQDPAGEDPASRTAAAREKLVQIRGEIERELRADSLGTDPADLRLPAGLMELRPDSPGGRGIRILFGVEPAGTALLIAVLEGYQAVRDQHAEAVQLSADILRQVRAGQSPESAAHAFDDAQAFLDEFFPGDADEVEVAAATFVARNRGRTLAEQRVRLGLTQAQVAERMGVRQERVSAIERAEPGATEIRTLAGYVKALGGWLEVTGDFGGERIVLR